MDKIGIGRVVNVHAGDFPSLGVLPFFSFSKEKSSVLSSLTIPKLKHITINGEDPMKKDDDEDLSALAPEEAQRIAAKKKERIEVFPLVRNSSISFDYVSL